jgi:hypothetical protein
MDSYALTEETPHSSNRFQIGDLTSDAREILLNKKPKAKGKPKAVKKTSENSEKEEGNIVMFTRRVAELCSNEESLKNPNSDDKTPITMSKLFGEAHVEVFKAALREECERSAFMQAVFDESILYTNGFFCLIKANNNQVKPPTTLYFRRHLGQHANGICLFNNTLYSYKKSDKSVVQLKRTLHKNDVPYDELVSEMDMFTVDRMTFATDEQHKHIKVLRGCAYNTTCKVSSLYY